MLSTGSKQAEIMTSVDSTTIMPCIAQLKIAKKITRDMRWIGPYYPIIACHNSLHIIELKMSRAEEMSQVNCTAISSYYK